MAISRFNTKSRVLGALLIAVLLAGSSISVSLARMSHASNNGLLTIGWTTETKTLDPAGNTQNPDIWVQVNMYDHLVRVGPDGKSIVPDLATHWTTSNNGTVYTFFLRK